MSTDELLAVAAKNYSLFKDHKSTIVNEGSRYLIFLPKEKIFAVGIYKGRKGSNLIF
jgi:hypothetical protein